MVVHAYYPLGETRVEREAAALVDAGFKVDVICLRDKGEHPQDFLKGVHIYRLPVARRRIGGFAGQFVEYIIFFVLAALKLNVLHSRQKYDTIQTHNLPDFLVFSALIPKLLGARVILDIHDLMPEFFASLTGRSPHSLLVRMVILQERISCWFADHVITVTEVWRERLISRGVSPEKVSVVMNVADEQIFRASDHCEPKAEEGGSFRLIYHGTYKQHYGMAELIQAIAIVKERIPGIHLVLQGIGEYHPDMVRLVDQLDLHDHVQINNFARPAEELPALIRQADVGIVPNRNDLFTGELLPTKLLEYVALGVPVVASRTRVISRYFDDTMIEFFSPGDPASLADHIIELHEDPERLRELVRNSRRFVQDHNWKAISRDYVALVRRLADGDVHAA
jgi:glycosyltransferase involved in cell wall biosynthesis